MANKIAGVDVLIWVQTGVDEAQKPIYKMLGGQGNATLNRSTSMIETTSKDEGAWTQNVAGVNTWSVDCDGYIVENDEALSEMETAWFQRRELKAQVRMPSGKLYEGYCFIGDFPVAFAKDDAATYQLSFTGNGALNVVEPDPAS